MSSDLFGVGGRAPLAARLRPTDIDEVVGQEALTGEQSPLRSLLRNGTGSSVILWGPPGTGKTTLARVIAESTGAEFVELSAVSATVKDVRAVIESARLAAGTGATAPVLFIDEIHRFSKTQQDALLPAVEDGLVILVGATTENPSFAVIPALLSRSLVLPLEPLSDEDVATLVERALNDERGLAQAYQLDQDAADFIVRLAGGDARRALTMLEAAAATARHDPDAPGSITVAMVESAAASGAPLYDRAGTRHYDVASAFIKSLRGSDVNAALHYLAVMVVAGEDPRFIARRMMILASEDIGMADPTALVTATAAHTAASHVGLPEASIILAQAVVHLALAPKSNAVYRAIGAAIEDVRAGRTGDVPLALRDGSTKSARSKGAGKGYRYPHDNPAGVLSQQYAPDAVNGRVYYEPTSHGAEARWAETYAKIERLLAEPPESGR